LFRKEWPTNTDHDLTSGGRTIYLAKYVGSEGSKKNEKLKDFYKNNGNDLTFYFDPRDA